MIRYIGHTVALSSPNIFTFTASFRRPGPQLTFNINMAPRSSSSSRPSIRLHLTDVNISLHIVALTAHSPASLFPWILREFQCIHMARRECKVMNGAAGGKGQNSYHQLSKYFVPLENCLHIFHISPTAALVSSCCVTTFAPYEWGTELNKLCSVNVSLLWTLLACQNNLMFHW